MCETVRVAGIVDDSITDGPGLRITIFTQGCSLSCPGCHNRDAQNADGGTPYTVDELYTRILQNPLATGVTFSGGEPLQQAGALVPLARRLKRSGYTLALYTGYTFEQILAQHDTAALELLSYIDTMVDGPFLSKRRDLSLAFRGSSNQRILDVQQSLARRAPVVETSPGWHPTR